MYIFHIVYSILNSTRIFYWFLYFLQNVLLNFSHFPIQIGITRYQIFAMNEIVSFKRQPTLKKRNKIENSNRKHRSNQSRSIYLHGIFRKPFKIIGYAFCFGGIMFWHIYIFHVAFPWQRLNTLSAQKTSIDRPTNQPCSLPCCIACDNDFDWNTRKRFDIHK